MIRTKLAKAISLAVAGLAVSATASASTTMYNMNDFSSATTNTDGWVWSDSTHAAGPSGNFSNYNSATRTANFVGTSSSSATPFGFNATSSLNWGIQLTGAGDSGQISAADSLARYGVTAEVDTGGGAWQDNVTPTGWKHQTDIGLIESDVTQVVHINLATLGNLTPSTFSTFGVTVFQGMDTSTASYSHHGAWNNPAAGKLFTADNPFGTVGLTNIGYSNNVTATQDFSFIAQAGQVYSVYLGGYNFSKWNTGVDGYLMNVTTSAVPVPGAVWLFGSAMAGMIGFGGRRKAAVAA
jgi:hypothetical protein